MTTESDGISHKRWSRRRGDGGRSIISGPSGRRVLSTAGLELGANRKGRVFEIGEGIGRTVSTTVNGANHTTVNSHGDKCLGNNSEIRRIHIRSAMAIGGVARLLAVHPNWVCLN